MQRAFPAPAPVAGAGAARTWGRACSGTQAACRRRPQPAHATSAAPGPLGACPAGSARRGTPRPSSTSSMAVSCASADTDAGAWPTPLATLACCSGLTAMAAGASTASAAAMPSQGDRWSACAAACWPGTAPGVRASEAFRELLLAGGRCMLPIPVAASVLGVSAVVPKQSGGPACGACAASTSICCGCSGGPVAAAGSASSSTACGAVADACSAKRSGAPCAAASSAPEAGTPLPVWSALGALLLPCPAAPERASPGALPRPAAAPPAPAAAAGGIA